MSEQKKDERVVMRPNTLDGGGGDPPPPTNDGGGSKSGLSANRPAFQTKQQTVSDGMLRLSLEMPYNADRKLVITINEA